LVFFFAFAATSSFVVTTSSATRPALRRRSCWRSWIGSMGLFIASLAASNAAFHALSEAIALRRSKVKLSTSRQRRPPSRH